MPLAKEIEFPLFHRGTFTSQSGAKVTFTDALLAQMARNSNFAAKSGILRAPVKYDHPAFETSKENHGRLARFEFRNGTLFAVGTDWSDTLVNDKKAGKRIAYSGEFAENFEYPDPAKGTQVPLGPTVVGLAILGADRPAIKNLKPLESFEFGEGITAVDAWETREGLRESGLVAQYCEGTKFFGEVENDTRRFFSEEKKEPSMTDAEIQALVERSVKAATEPLQTKITEQSAQIKSFGETSKRATEAHSFCEKLADDRRKASPLPKLFMEKLEDVLSDPEATPGVIAKVRSLAESAPGAFVDPRVAGKGKGKETPVTEEDEEETTDVPSAILALRPKHFADLDGNEVKIHAGLVAFAEMPEGKGLDKKSQPEQIAMLKKFVDGIEATN